MFSRKFLPKFVKELIQHFPTLAFQCINWTEIFKQIGPILQKIGTGTLPEHEFKQLVNLNISNLEIVRDFSHLNHSTQLNKIEGIKAGETLLETYFAQLKNPGVIVDLRPRYFKSTGGRLFWSPNNSWFQFESTFSQGLVGMYKGYYFNNDLLFSHSLDKIGLSNGLSNSKKAELTRLFHVHFGAGEQEQVSFRVEKFEESFYHIFDFFVQNKIKIGKDFLFLGVYLVTLYTHLEFLGHEFNVRKAFFKVFNEAS